MHGTSLEEAKAFAPFLKGDTDVTVTSRNICGKLVVDIILTGEAGTMKYHGECVNGAIETADGLFDHKVEGIVKRLCVSERGIAIWFDGEDRIRFLYRQAANLVAGCTHTFEVTRSRVTAAA